MGRRAGPVNWERATWVGLQENTEFCKFREHDYNRDSFVFLMVFYFFFSPNSSLRRISSESPPRQFVVPLLEERTS